MSVLVALPSDHVAGQALEEPSAEMGVSRPTGERAPSDPEVVERFKKAYVGARPSKRPVFDEYLPILGAEVIFDYLEARYPACHEQSHDLGRAIFVRTKDVGAALRECGTRCTSGCMHGVIGEAFGGESLDRLTGMMNEFCVSGAMAEIHKPGNCAHGLGHAFMFVTDHDVQKSLDACVWFEQPGMQYYCSTGVFMEYFVTGRRPDPKAAERSLHYPCDLYTQFPAACYRYKAVKLLTAFNDDRTLVAKECETLSGARRLGCFHGLGAVSTGIVMKDPSALATTCGAGTTDDRTMCIEGVIEKIANVDSKVAETACGSLSGDLAKVCLTAAKEKMHRIDKPTLHLYYDPEAVGKRKPLGDSMDHSAHAHPR